MTRLIRYTALDGGTRIESVSETLAALLIQRGVATSAEED